jgi:protein ImuA
MRLTSVLPIPSTPAAIDRAVRNDVRWATGIAALDAIMGGGKNHGRVHEFYATEQEDAAAIAGFAAALAIGMTSNTHPALWLRSRRAVTAGGVLQGEGWAELGGATDACIFGLFSDSMNLLRAAVDALRCGGLGVVIIESWGGMAELDLTASRRFALAAEKSAVPLLLLRIDATPSPSAAQTRWQVTSAPSHALPGNAPGMPTFDIELLRQRSGPFGMRWRLEWDRDQRIFRDAALSGAVVPVPSVRPAADTGTGTLRRVA